jgi:hypothetical protein
VVEVRQAARRHTAGAAAAADDDVDFLGDRHVALYV